MEMDAAWALYESILKIRMGQAESALIYGFGKSSPGELPIVLSQQLDPYYLAPLWVDNISLAAMQARMMLDQGLITERDMADVVSRSRRNALDNPHAQLKGDVSVEELLAAEHYLSPLGITKMPRIMAPRLYFRNGELRFALSNTGTRSAKAASSTGPGAKPLRGTSLRNKSACDSMTHCRTAAAMGRASWT